MKDFAGKVAVVTGAGSGIGQALALRFAAEGMRVALADIDEGALEESQERLAEASPDVATLDMRVDVRRPEDLQAFADEVYATWGQVDVLCNNAGVFVGGFLWNRPLDQIKLVMDVNLWGILHGIQAFVPRMIAQDTEGHIVNTASVAGLFGSPFSGPYNISKFAAFAAAETLAGDLIASGSKLRASVLCPGIINTHIAQDAFERPDREGFEPTEDERFVTDLLVDVVKSGKDPAEAAQSVLDGIRDERFLILTHDHHAAYLLQRAEQLMERTLPTVVDYS